MSCKPIGELRIGFRFDAAAIQAVKTASHQTEVVGGYTVLRTNKTGDTLRCLGEWTNALSRKYAHLTVSCTTKAFISALSAQSFAISSCALLSDAQTCQTSQLH